MDAPFKIGDMVVCVLTKDGYVEEGKQYIIRDIYRDEDDGWLVKVEGSVANMFARRFVKLEDSIPVNQVIRKIKYLELRFQQRAAA